MCKVSWHLNELSEPSAAGDNASALGNLPFYWAASKHKHSSQCSGRSEFWCCRAQNLFFFNLTFILYWSIVDLQYCVSFRCTAKLLSYTYIHSFSDSFPVQVITGYGVEFPVLCSRSLLITCFIYSRVYMLIPNS